MWKSKEGCVWWLHDSSIKLLYAYSVCTFAFGCAWKYNTNIMICATIIYYCISTTTRIWIINAVSYSIQTYRRVSTMMLYPFNDVSSLIIIFRYIDTVTMVGTGAVGRSMGKLMTMGAALVCVCGVEFPCVGSRDASYSFSSSACSLVTVVKVVNSLILFWVNSTVRLESVVVSAAMEDLSAVVDLTSYAMALTVSHWISSVLFKLKPVERVVYYILWNSLYTRGNSVLKKAKFIPGARRLHTM